MSFDDIVLGSAEAKAAYKRVKETAATLVAGVWLGPGDVLLLNRRKATHGRGPYEAKYVHRQWRILGSGTHPVVQALDVPLCRMIEFCPFC